MNLHTPPECQGQIVEVAYGDACNGMVYRRTLDRSDGSERWERAEYGDLFPECDCDDGCPHWAPWDREPGGDPDAWQPCDAPTAV